jgi:Uncharacterized protein conserved in bacteria
MKKTWGDVKHFQFREFDSPDSPGSGIHMDLEFVLLLDQLRERIGVPLKINSGYRSTQHNAKVGGVDSSSHTLGWAADIHADTDELRARIILEASALGIKRIGIAKTFVHLDVDPTKHAPRLWLYP